MPAGAVLDADALDRLRALDPHGSNGIVKRVMQAYANSLTKLLAQLEVARVKPDLDGIRHVAHTLKSSSASIGALAFSKHCAQVEAMVRAQHLDGLQGHLDGLFAESRQVAAAVAVMLD